jgi:ATP-dependent Clp protease ATP-binding subunit ClpA
VLFIDEIHTVIGAGATSGGAMDASNLLKPALSVGRDPLHRLDHLQGIPPVLREGPGAGPPLPEDRRQRADDRGRDRDHEGPEALFRGVSQARYTNEAIKAAVELSARYINDRKLPDKAIDVIDETGAAQMLVPPEQASQEDHRHQGDRGDDRDDGAHPAEERVEGRRRCSPISSRTEAVVYGQDKAIEALSTSAIKLAVPACANRTSRSAPTCSPARPASARPKWPSSWRRRSASS